MHPSRPQRIKTFDGLMNLAINLAPLKKLAILLGILLIDLENLVSASVTSNSLIKSSRWLLSNELYRLKGLHQNGRESCPAIRVCVPSRRKDTLARY